MGRRTKSKLIIRSIILLLTTLAVVIDVNLVSKIMNLKLIGNIKVQDIF